MQPPTTVVDVDPCVPEGPQSMPEAMERPLRTVMPVLARLARGSA